MLTQIAKIIISYKNIIYFCCKLQKYTIQFVYLHQRNFETRRTAMKKAPSQRMSAAAFFNIWIYLSLLLNTFLPQITAKVRYEITYPINSKMCIYLFVIR